jgi:AraC-like DNA-binding protein
MYIRQDNYKYTIRENQYLILLADHEHEGLKPSGGPLSYYWCHFRAKNDDYRIAGQGELPSVFDPTAGEHFSQYYVLPEYGDISGNGRAILIFRQLLDIARSENYSENLPNYALSLLAMEISQEYIEKNLRSIANKEINPGMEKVIEWVRINYGKEDLTLEIIAKIFRYNPDYLSTAFRVYMGIPLMKYITRVKIDNAKKLLLQTRDSVKEIAYKVGFNDEKTFMKRFKQYEDITPTKYRNAFSRAKLIH